MAQAYKCDICGEFYETRNTLIVNDRINAYFCWKSLPSSNITRKEKICDICPDCIATIQKAIDERKKEGDDDQY